MTYILLQRYPLMSNLYIQSLLQQLNKIKEHLQRNNVFELRRIYISSELIAVQLQLTAMP